MAGLREKRKLKYQCFTMPWEKGKSGNPAGRPKGSGISITRAIKLELEKIPNGERRSNLELLVKKIMKKAMKEGDSQTIKQVWAYIDGLPVAKTELSGPDGEPLNIRWQNDRDSNSVQTEGVGEGSAQETGEVESNSGPPA